MTLTNRDVLKLTIEKAKSLTDEGLTRAIIEAFGFNLGEKPFADRPFIQRVKTFKRAKEVESLELPIIKKAG
jgi:hypothetical protein